MKIKTQRTWTLLLFPYLAFHALRMGRASAFQPQLRCMRTRVRCAFAGNTSKIRQNTNRIYASLDDEEENNDFSQEETLLQVHLSLLPDIPLEIAIEKVSKYAQSFPFAAVLPVQPLHYLPTEDGGVDVRFLVRQTFTFACQIDNSVFVANKMLWVSTISRHSGKRRKKREVWMGGSAFSLVKNGMELTWWQNGIQKVKQSPKCFLRNWWSKHL